MIDDYKIIIIIIINKSFSWLGETKPQVPLFSCSKGSLSEMWEVDELINFSWREVDSASTGCSKESPVDAAPLLSPVTQTKHLWRGQQ